MFCPNCGKDNSVEIKFCASCGTNLEAVSQVLTGREADFFSKIDSGMDQLIARYSDHVFGSTRPGSLNQNVSESWKLLGQGVVTSLTDLLLFVLMSSFLPLRFLMLSVSTPFRLLSERNRDQSSNEQYAAGGEPRELNKGIPGEMLPVPSVTEGTTLNLRKTASSKRETAPITDQLK